MKPNCRTKMAKCIHCLFVVQAFPSGGENIHQVNPIRNLKPCQCLPIYWQWKFARTGQVNCSSVFAESHHTEHSNNEQVALLRLWKGDFGDVLRDAAAKRELNDWLVAMAPMGKFRTMLTENSAIFKPNTWKCRWSTRHGPWELIVPLSPPHIQVFFAHIIHSF